MVTYDSVQYNDDDDVYNWLQILVVRRLRGQIPALCQIQIFLSCRNLLEK